MLINYENLFLIILAIIWISIAILQDLRKREVDNLWNFSLIAFALAYRVSISVYTGNYWFILNGIFGFLIFLGLGNLFYYSRLFAGGDAKLLIALGAILPLSYDWLVNLKIFGLFIILFLLGGSVYSIFYALFLVFRNLKKFNKEFSRQWKKYSKMFFIFLIFTIVFTIVLVLFKRFELILLGIIILLFPVLFVFSKAIEESCLIKKIKPSQIREGDWLYEDIFIGRNKIKASWEGVSKKELGLIKKGYRKNILIKQGIPFTPSFLIGLICLLFLFWKFPVFF